MRAVTLVLSTILVAFAAPAGAQEVDGAHSVVPSCSLADVGDGTVRVCELVAIRSAALVSRCRREGDVIHCENRLEVALESRADVAIELPLEVIVPYPEGVEVQVDGAAARAAIALGPGETRLVRLERHTRGEIHDQPFAIFTELQEIAPLRVRHPVFGDASPVFGPRRATIGFGLTDFMHPRSGWASIARLERDVELPAGFDWVIEDDGGGEVNERPPSSPIANGGPVVAAGYTFDHGARIAIGYELGLHEGWTALVGAITADLLFAEESVQGTIALTIEAATPSVWWVLPSISIGLGPAIAIASDVRFVLRGLAQITWPIGLALFVDVYPDTPEARVTLAGRLSL